MDLLLDGFQTALTPTNLLFAVLGVLLGTAVGVLPGIGPAMTVALLLPVTYNVSPSSAIIMFAGIYYGGMYGGSTTSILLNTPGESSSVVTAIEGNKMAKAGRAAQALATAAIGSFVAGTIGTILLVLLAPPVADVVVTARRPVVLRDHAARPLRGHRRARRLQAARVHRAVPRAGHRAGRHVRPARRGSPSGSRCSPTASTSWWSRSRSSRSARRSGSPPTCAASRWRSSRSDSPWMGREDWRRSWKPWLRGTAFGFPFGALPAGGAEIPTFLSYATERKLSKHPEEFGKGAIEGVAGPEAANNASAAGTLVPLLAIGLPTTATAAVILLAMQSYGIQPGPQLMDTEPELVWGLLASLFVANALLLVLNLPLAPIWAKLLQIPRPVPVRRHPVLRLARRLQRQLPGLRPRSAARPRPARLGDAALRDFPVLPLIIGVILGPRLEAQLTEALAISQGDVSTLWSEPVAVVVYVVMAHRPRWA